MSELITSEIFMDGQKNINAANMNGIVGGASVQPDVILNKPVSAAMDVADQFLVLKTNNTLARAQFNTIVNSTSSALPLCDTTKNGMLRQVSGKSTDFVDGTNNCQPLSNLLPPGVVVDFAGAVIPAGWLNCNGASLLQATYPGLFAAIGTMYGSVDGTHFNLPNFTGRIAAGAGGSFGAVATPGGAASVALAITHLASHTHTMGNHTHVGANHTHNMQNHTHLGVDHTHAIPAGQFSHNHSDSGHTHTYSMIGGSGPWALGGGGQSIASFNTGAASANIQANTLPAGGTGAMDRGATTGGPSVASTSFSEQGLTTAGPSTNTSDATGSGTAFSILPPFLSVYKIIKT